MTRPPRLRPPARFIYVIGPEIGLQKVGLATDPHTRLATLQTASPFDLLLHAAIAVPFGDAHAVERKAHRLLARTCVRNEWFETTPTVATDAVHSAAAPWVQRAAPSQPSPSDWRISRAHRPIPLPAGLPPLTNFTRAAPAAEKPPAPLPLFEFQPPERPAMALETPIETLAAYRLEVRCCAGATSYPLGLLAASLPQRGRTPLGAALGLFRCDRCGAAAREAVLVGRDAGAAWRIGGGETGYRS